MRNLWKSCSILLFVATLAACGGGVQMTPSGEAPVIRAGESLVVFMRPSALGGAIAASVFDVTGADTQFVGLVNYNTKFAHPVKPGQYTFMVVGESADFLQATVEAGRTYYVLVTPRMGVWKARFSFRPLRLHELEGAEFAGWSAATQYVSNTPETHAWAAANTADVNEKRTQYWPEWSSKPEHQRASQTLNAGDGRPSLQLAAAPAAIAAPLAAAAAAPVAQIAPSAPSSRLPREGDTWTYRLTEKRSDAPREYVAKVATVTSTSITEQFTLDGSVGTWTHGVEREVVPLGKALFAPYMTVFSDHPPLTRLGKIPVSEAVCGNGYVCEATAWVAAKETVRTPAGTFETVRVEVDQSWKPRAFGGQFGAQLYGSRRLMIWYSQQAKRAVKFSSRPGKGVPSSNDIDFDLELVSYQVK